MGAEPVDVDGDATGTVSAKKGEDGPTKKEEEGMNPELLGKRDPVEVDSDDDDLFDDDDDKKEGDAPVDES